MKTEKNVKKRGRLLLVFVMFLLVVGVVNAQIGIGTAEPNGSALLDIVSIDKGLLIPRVEITDLGDATTPVDSPVESLLVYNTNATTGKGYYYWVPDVSSTVAGVWIPVNHLTNYSASAGGKKIGKKWIDGVKDIYEIVKTGTTTTAVTTTTDDAGVDTTTTNISAVLTFDGAIADLTKVIDIRVIGGNVIYNSASYNVDGAGATATATVTVNFGGVNTALPSGDYYVIIQYLK